MAEKEGAKRCELTGTRVSLTVHGGGVNCFSIHGNVPQTYVPVITAAQKLAFPHGIPAEPESTAGVAFEYAFGAHARVHGLAWVPTDVKNQNVR